MSEDDEVYIQRLIQRYENEIAYLRGRNELLLKVILEPPKIKYWCGFDPAQKEGDKDG